MSEPIQTPPISLHAEGQDLLRQVVDYYHQTLKTSPEALDYLKARGIHHPEAIERFKLGYANRSLGLTLPVKQLKAGAEIRGRLASIGLYRESGHEHFNGSLVIPILDEAGAVVQVYGRKLLDNLRKGTPLHTYLPGSQRGVWNLEAFKESKEIILAKSLIDALTFWCAGFRNVTAAYGVNGFTHAHLEAFKRYRTQRVLIAFDWNEAGEAATKQVSDQLSAHGIGCYRIQFPKGMDANSLALKSPSAAKALGQLIRQAACMAEGTALSSNQPLPLMPMLDASKPTSAPSDRSLAAAPSLPSSEAHAPSDLLGGSMQPSVSTPDQTVKQTLIQAVIPSVIQSAIPLYKPSVIHSVIQPPIDPAASTVPPSPVDDLPHEVQGQDLLLSMSGRTYRVRGWQKPLNPETLKVNLMVSRGERFHVDSLDLYHAKARTAFIRQAGMELGVSEDALKLDLGKVLRKVEGLQSELLAEALKVKDPRPTLTEAEQMEAMALLQSPDLMKRILRDFEALGTVGEESNKLTGYLAAVSRLLDRSSIVRFIRQASNGAVLR